MSFISVCTFYLEISFIAKVDQVSGIYISTFYIRSFSWNQPTLAGAIVETKAAAVGRRRSEDGVIV